MCSLGDTVSWQLSDVFLGRARNRAGLSPNRVKRASFVLLGPGDEENGVASVFFNICLLSISAVELDSG